MDLSLYAFAGPADTIVLFMFTSDHRSLLGLGKAETETPRSRNSDFDYCFEGNKKFDGVTVGTRLER